MNTLLAVCMWRRWGYGNWKTICQDYWNACEYQLVAFWPTKIQSNNTLCSVATCRIWCYYLGNAAHKRLVCLYTTCYHWQLHLYFNHKRIFIRTISHIFRHYARSPRHGEKSEWVRISRLFMSNGIIETQGDTEVNYHPVCYNTMDAI